MLWSVLRDKVKTVELVKEKDIKAVWNFKIDAQMKWAYGCLYCIDYIGCNGGGGGGILFSGLGKFLEAIYLK